MIPSADKPVKDTLSPGQRELLGRYLSAVHKKEVDHLVAAPDAEFRRIQGRVQMLRELAREMNLSLEK